MSRKTIEAKVVVLGNQGNQKTASKPNIQAPVWLHERQYVLLTSATSSYGPAGICVLSVQVWARLHSS